LLVSVRRVIPVKTRNTMVQTTIVDASQATLSQAHSRVVAGISQLESNAEASSHVTATLVAGANVVVHGLGRIPQACQVTPTTASTSFAFALTSADDKSATITTVGPTQTNCTIRFS
jgi:hypothetical protein